MTDRNLSASTEKELDKLVERVARKAGCTGSDQISYYEQLQQKLTHTKVKAEKKLNRVKIKLGMTKGQPDFAEEIRGYLRDGLIDRMQNGASEQEALSATLAAFDQNETAQDFAGLMAAYDQFGLEDLEMNKHHGSMAGDETVGLFFAAFTVLFPTIGGLLGWLLGSGWVAIGVGVGTGFLLGTGAGLLTMAILSAKRNKQ